MKNTNKTKTQKKLKHCSSDSLQHDRGSRFPGCCCTCMEQPIPGVSNSFGGAGHTARYHSVGGPQCF